MNKAVAAIAAGVLMLATGQAIARITPADRTFATKAAAGGQAEVVLGRLATQKAGSQQVRQFSQQMVTDHTQAYQELQAIAKQQNPTLPCRCCSSICSSICRWLSRSTADGEDIGGGGEASVQALPPPNRQVTLPSKISDHQGDQRSGKWLLLHEVRQLIRLRGS